MTDIPELTDEDFQRTTPHHQRERLIRGEFHSGDDGLALRKFVRLTQEVFAQAPGISVHTLRNWEQGRRFPGGQRWRYVAWLHGTPELFERMWRRRRNGRYPHVTKRSRIFDARLL